MSAYRAASGNVFAVVDVTAPTTVVSATSASYVDGAKRQFETTWTGPSEIAAGATGSMIYTAEGAEFGGTLSLEIYDAETHMTVAHLDVPVR